MLEYSRGVCPRTGAADILWGGLVCDYFDAASALPWSNLRVDIGIRCWGVKQKRPMIMLSPCPTTQQTEPLLHHQIRSWLLSLSLSRWLEYHLPFQNVRVPPILSALVVVWFGRRAIRRHLNDI